MNDFLQYFVVFCFFTAAMDYSRCFTEWSDAYFNKGNAKLPPTNSDYFFIVSSGKYISLIKIYHITAIVFEYFFLLYVFFFVKWWFAVLLLVSHFLKPLIYIRFFPKEYNFYLNGGYQTANYWQKALRGFYWYPILVFLIIYFLLPIV